MSDVDYEPLFMRMGFRIKTKDILDHAFRHTSYVNEHDMQTYEGNERLEFLGDSILGFVVTEYLYRSYPEWSEGVLSKIKSIVVSKKILAQRSLVLGLGNYIKLGKGEDLSGGRKREGILADSFESLVGAIHISGGIRASRAFVLRQLKKEIKRAAEGNSIRDYKSELQEITQRDMGQIPKYRVINTTGPDHDKTFEVEVRLKGILLGKGKGKSKKSSEQAAAEKGLLRLTSKGWDE